MVPWALDDDDYDIMRILHEFTEQFGIQALSGPALHLVRIAVEISVNSDAAVGKITRNVEAGSQAVLQWIHDMEAYLLRSDE